MNVCELSSNLPAYRGKTVTVTGVYYSNLQQECPNSCAVEGWPSYFSVQGWPSYFDLIGADDRDIRSWNALGEAEERIEHLATKDRRFEIWVTVVGKLDTNAQPSPLGPCDRIGSHTLGYGHLGAYPGQIVVRRFLDIKVKENPNSPYDYSDMYHGPL